MRIALFLCLLLAPLRAFAGADGTLSLSPAVVMLHGDHGQSTSQTLTLVNGTSRAFAFDLVAQDVIIRDGKRTFVEAGSVAGSIAATAVFSQQQVLAGPGESVSVTVTATLPPATSQRAMVAMFRGTNTVMSGHVPMTASLGSLLTFSISDEVTLASSELTVRPQSSSSNLAISQTCTNSGREPLVAKGVLAVLDEGGKLVGKSAMNPHRLLPGESANLDVEYPGELEAGRYRVFVTYEYEGRSHTASSEVIVP